MIGSIYPLSPMQEGLVFHTLAAPDTGAYAVQFEVALHGDLDADVLREAWRRVAERHPALRTLFTVERSPEILQVVLKEVQIAMHRDDLRGVLEPERKARIASYLEADRLRGFDLKRAPLTRVQLFQLADAEHRMVWTVHHAVMDGWSWPLVLNDLFDIYATLAAGSNDVRLPASPPYEAYIEWLQAQDKSVAEAYWRRRLEGMAGPTSLPWDRRPSGRADMADGTAIVSFAPAEATAGALSSLARDHRLTMNTIVQGAWTLLLSRYSGDQDVVYGVTQSGRPAALAGVETMTGCFLNTMPFRVSVDGSSELASWLRQLQVDAAEQREHDYASLLKVQEWSRVPRGQPLFETLFVFENYPVVRGSNRSSSLRVEPLAGHESTNYALTVVCAESPLRFKLMYDPAWLDASTVERIAGHLGRLLEGIVANPRARLSDLTLLSEAEHRQLVVEGNETADYPAGPCLHERFARQAAATPDAMAVTFEEQCLTYAELNRRANQLAHWLRSRGVGPDVLVGLLLERGLDVVVSILGILKAGGAYVPLDLANPQERIAFILNDTKIRLLVTESSLLANIPAHAAECLCVDRERELLEQQPADDPRAQLDPHAAAYVIYTSGSTGKPKGVVIEHGTVTRLFGATEEWFDFGQSDVWTLFHSFAFDFSVWEMWGALLYGGRLVVVPYAVSRSPDEFYSLLVREGVTVLNQTPSAFRQLIAADGSRRADSQLALNWVIFGGEALDLQTLRPWFERHGDQRPQLVNMYGITETTVHVTYRPLRARDLDAVSGSVIGQRIPDLRVYILDANLQPVPLGVPGELYVGGAGVARGYLNRPELTAERFLPDPFAPQPGSRLYRTGDVARYLPDRDIEYRGRNDDQVKIRGFRIELGEIESALLSHPAVAEVVVLVREERAGDRRLVAYFVPESGASLDTAQARAFLEERVPSYMLPGAFVELAALPLTANGKLDRRALPAPLLSPHQTSYVAPRNGNEEVLCAIWRDVLGVEQVGVHDDFFELGGHSLLATQLVARVRRALAIEIPLRALLDHATVSRLAARMESDGARSATPPLTRREGDHDVALSFAQQRLWVLDRMDVGAAYNLLMPLRLTGFLDPDKLEQAVQTIVDRHDVLRTCFPEVDGQPVQRIEATLNLELARHDVQDLPAEAREAEVLRVAGEQLQRAFDLKRGPLLRTALLRLGESEHVLLLAIHHIVADDWSFGVLFSELSALYEAFGRGAVSPLPELEIQYADFAQWQRSWLRDEALETQLSYWCDQLARCPTLDLLTDHPRPAMQTYSGASFGFAVPAEVAEELRQLGRRSGATMAMVLLAGWQALLARYTGQEDIAVGSPIANRTHRELEPLIGFFVNTLVLRTDLSGDPSFEELLRRVQAVSLAAYEHQDLPFEEVVATLNPQRDQSRHPLFQVLFTIPNAPRGALRLGDLEIDSVRVPTTQTRFDLELHCVEHEAGLAGRLIYNVDLFDASTIERMVGHFGRLLAGVVANPRARLSELPLSSVQERHQLLVEWNDTAEVHPAECIHDLVEAQMARTPNAPAVAFGDQRLTYRELDARANQLAHTLRKLGVGPDDRVGLCVERSLEMVVALLGILKAGGAYVPMDPTYPQLRLEHMVTSCGAKVLITQAHLLTRMPEHDAAVLAVDRDAAEIAAAPAHRPDVDVSPDHLAYVLYTSGSTGRPKGAALPHAALMNLLRWQLKSSPPGSAARTIQFGTLGFDQHFLDVFATLPEGGTVFVVPDELRRDPLALLDFLETNAITRAFMPYPAVRQMAEVAQETGRVPRSLRLVITAGEALQITDAMRWLFGQLPECILCNQYGPAETHVVTALDLQAPTEAWPMLPNIGRPIINTAIYVLDRQGEPVPIGVTGELFIGGQSVGRGYAGAPSLTAERFVPDPFGGKPGARLYRTGDLARHRADGSIVFLGRADFQVKIRGFRIELGEVEAVLAQHPAVGHAVAAVREDRQGDRRLIAYAVPKDNASPAGIELQAFLRDRLPAYMVPSAIVVLESLPLSPTGKVDRRALPAPDPRDGTAGFVGPRNGREELLCAIWCEVLGVERVGVHDDFFELGGHSLLAIQLLSTLNRTFAGSSLTLRSIFGGPTVAQLAERLREHAAGSTARRLHPAPRDRPLPLSPAQERLWFLNQLEGERALYNVPLALRLHGALDAAALQWSLNEIVRRHEILRTTFAYAEGELSQASVPHEEIQVAVVDLSAAADPAAEARRVAHEASQRSFDLSIGPVYRFELLRLAPAEHVLLVVIHHAAVDMGSLGVVCDELAQLYQARTSGQPSPLAELPVQYADYAYWQRQWYEQDARADLAYWRERLAALPTLELPTDRPRPARQTSRGSVHEFAISAAVTDRLKELCRAEGCTTFMAVLAAFKVLLARYSGQQDIVVGTPIANRGMPEIEPLIGLFLNTLVLRTDLSGEPSFRDVLARLRQVSLDAFAHGEMPFEQLVHELQPQRDLSRHPLFQVLFVINEEPRGLLLGDIRAEPFGTGSVSARFDLTLGVVDASDGLYGGIEYNLDLFDAATIERMAQHLQLLIEALVEQPDQSILDLPILTESELLLLRQQNQTAADYPRDSTFHELFEARVASDPGATAAICGGQPLTFGELNARANRLGQHLRSLGAGTGTLVGVSVERGLDMLVALLGILKSGAAYVPLDPSYPVDRLSFILSDAGVELLVTQESLRSELPAELPRLVRLDADAEAIAAHSDDNLAIGSGPDSLAYVIFTSGSTGLPKGVQIEHRALVNLLSSMAREPGLSADDVLVAVTTISFDIAGLELFLPLLVGGVVVIAEHGVEADGFKLANLLRSSGATAMQATPATWQLLVVVGWEDRGLKALCGGEALPRELAEVLLSRCSELWNMYGPTETTIWSLVHRVKSEVGPVPIGGPIANTEVHVLDARGQRVPIGALGELHLGGTGVARGYWNRPALTAEKFVTHPFSSEGGARLYKTGDVVRVRADGTLMFAGRTDHQVKIRGFRIELGEIESVLEQHPAVKRAVATVQTDVTGPRLVGHVVSEETPQNLVPELLELLRGKLPAYMVPAFFEIWSELPLTPNGKIDRRALAAATPSLPLHGGDGVPPATAMEKLVAEIWRDVLGIDSVSVHDNFLDLGGHSLLAIQVGMKIRERAGVRVDLLDFFVQTLGQLAAQLEAVPHAVKRRRWIPTALRRLLRWGRPRAEPGVATKSVGES